MLSPVFRRLFLAGLTAAFERGELQFFTDIAGLNDPEAFDAALAPLRSAEWIVCAKRPLAGPEQVLAYLARYSHRVAITNTRLLAVDDTHVSFRWKDYQQSGDHKDKVMHVTIAEFIRRFLLHVLPTGFHRIRYYGLLANGHRADRLALCRSLIGVLCSHNGRNNDDANGSPMPSQEPPPCPCCGGRMKIIETFNGPLSRPYHVRRLYAL